MRFILRPQQLKLIMRPFPYLNAAIRRTGQQIRRLSNSFMKIGKIRLNPVVFLKPIEIKVPGNTVDNFIMGLEVFDNLKFAVVDSYGAIRKSHREKTLNFTGIKR